MRPALFLLPFALWLAAGPAGALTLGVEETGGVIGSGGATPLLERRAGPTDPAAEIFPPFGGADLAAATDPARGPGTEPGSVSEFILRDLGRDRALGTSRLCGPGALAELRDLCDYLADPETLPTGAALPLE
jgi:hypothetical protein